MEGGGGFFPFGGGDPEDSRGAARSPSADRDGTRAARAVATLTLSPLELTARRPGSDAVSWGRPRAGARASRPMPSFPRRSRSFGSRQGLGARRSRRRKRRPYIRRRGEASLALASSPRAQSPPPTPSAADHVRLRRAEERDEPGHVSATELPAGLRRPSRLASLFVKCRAAPVSTTPRPIRITRIPRAPVAARYRRALDRRLRRADRRSCRSPHQPSLEIPTDAPRASSARRRASGT